MTRTAIRLTVSGAMIIAGIVLVLLAAFAK